MLDPVPGFQTALVNQFDFLGVVVFIVFPARDLECHLADRISLTAGLLQAESRIVTAHELHVARTLAPVPLLEAETEGAGVKFFVQLVAALELQAPFISHIKFEDLAMPAAIGHVQALDGDHFIFPVFRLGEGETAASRLIFFVNIEHAADFDLVFVGVFFQIPQRIINALDKGVIGVF